MKINIPKIKWTLAEIKTDADIINYMYPLEDVIYKIHGVSVEKGIEELLFIGHSKQLATTLLHHWDAIERKESPFTGYENLNFYYVSIKILTWKSIGNALVYDSSQLKNIEIRLIDFYKPHFNLLLF